ncbi:MAG: leucine-rich repeat domain-containing protein [Bacteroidaceae bacterium]|nr:leucine-rich repeat domain-containing protein [Bacteroidaceae bacterium]
MQKTKHWLMTIATLLCSIMVNAATYPDWTSTNKGQGNSTSSNTYTISAAAGDVLTFDWEVSSESGWDKLIVTVDGTEILNESGEASGTYQHTFDASGAHTMIVKYTKDGSADYGEDCAMIYNIVLDDIDEIVTSGTCDRGITWSLSSRGVLRIEGSGDAISNPWIDYSFDIKKIVIGNGVTSIGDGLFFGCNRLTSISISESVKSIGYNAFRDCSSLIDVDIPEGVTKINSFAFMSCSDLTSVTIPQSVTNIAPKAFYGCSNLCSIIVEEGNPIYDSREDCNAIIVSSYNSLAVGCKATIIPQSVTIIENEAFAGMAIKSIVIPKDITSIGSMAFEDCQLTSITCEAITPPTIEYYTFESYYLDRSIPVYVPESSIPYYQSSEYWSEFTNFQPITPSNACGDNLTWELTGEGELIIEGYGPMYDYIESSLPWGDYTYRELIKTVTIKGDVTSIGNSAFHGCYNLTTITIPESVTKIGNNAFKGCYELTSITIPESVTSVGRSAFENCSGLTTITLPEGIVSIENKTFYRCYGLTSITIPESVTSIGDKAFYYCNFLTITIPEGVTSIGESAFEQCSELTSITLPEGITTIGNKTFYGCGMLTSVTIPEGVTSIGESAFEYCSNLASISIPASVTKIGDYAFRYLGNVSTINVAEGNTTYDSREDCNALIESSSNKLILGSSSTVIPQTVTSIGEYAFYRCRNLTSINIPTGVTSIGKYAFSECSNLSSIVIPEGITIIEEATFSHCENLTSITIPKSISSIGDYAFFMSGSKLTALTCQASTPPNVNYYTFEGINKSVPVYVPASSISAYQKATYWSKFTNIQPIVLDVEISDAEGSFEQEGNETCTSITYTRTFNNTNWQSLYVPFDIDYNNIKDDFDVAYINDVHQFDDDNDGSIDRTQVEAIKITTGVLDANYPYLIRAKEVGEKVITLEDAVLYATEENSIDCSSVFRNYTFTGSYTTKTAVNLPASEGYYALTGGEWKQLSETAKLGAFRVYLKIDCRVAGEEVAEAISMRVVGEDGDDATGIDTSEFKSQNSEFIYDLMGRRVENPAKGVYIVNGVKRVF